MAKRDFQEIISELRHDAKQQARQQALLVPWPRIEETAAVYVDWLGFSLWVRAICSAYSHMPSTVRATLQSKCPEFADEAARTWRDGDVFVWRALQGWIESHHFADATREGWFNAVVYYAHVDLQSEQAWSHWDRTTDAWQNNAPARVPSFDEWKRQIALHPASQRADERGVALRQRTRVEGNVLAAAAAGLIEARGRALWISCCCDPEAVLPSSVVEELRRSIPELCRPDGCLTWDRSLFIRIIRRAEAPWLIAARNGHWSRALRYNVLNHPRYHRIVHYFQKCEDERLASRGRRCFSTFADWLAAADRYQLSRVTAGISGDR